MKTFLKEKDGSDSSARLIFVVGSLWNMAMATYLIFQKADTVTVLAYFSGIQAVLIGLKLGQKTMEAK